MLQITGTCIGILLLLLLYSSTTLQLYILYLCPDGFDSYQIIRNDLLGPVTDVYNIRYLYIDVGTHIYIPNT